MRCYGLPGQVPGPRTGVLDLRESLSSLTQLGIRGAKLKKLIKAASPIEWIVVNGK
jgi:hypothetical protein